MLLVSSGSTGNLLSHCGSGRHRGSSTSFHRASSACRLSAATLSLAGSASASSLGAAGATSLQRPGSVGGLEAITVAGTTSLQRPSSVRGFDAVAEQRRQADCCVRLVCNVETDFDIACWVSLETGQVDGPDLPLIVAATRGDKNNSCKACYVGTADGVVGSLVIEGFRNDIPFHVRPALVGESFVVEPGRQRAAITVLAPKLETTGGAPTLPPGAKGAATAEFRVEWDDPSTAALRVHVRRATEAEVRRQQ